MRLLHRHLASHNLEHRMRINRPPGLEVADPNQQLSPVPLIRDSRRHLKYGIILVTLLLNHPSGSKVQRHLVASLPALSRLLALAADGLWLPVQVLLHPIIGVIPLPAP